ncbi:MAG: agmatinase [Candidatus Hermodarchaeota archaeon]
MNSKPDIAKSFFNATTNNIEVANLCVLGLPWDASSSYRKGAHNAPTQIREATSGELYNSIPETGINIVDTWRIYDCGNVDIYSKTVTEAREEVYKSLKRVFRSFRRFLFLGGDHLATYFTFHSLTKLNGKNTGIIYLDAHPDLYDEYEGNKYSHACVLRRIIDDTKINPENIIQVGIRAPTPAQSEYAEKVDIKIISTKEFQANGALKTAKIVRNYLSNNLDEVYLSIDLDVLDPAYVPGIGNPQPGGLSTRAVIDFIHGLQGIKLIAADFVELCPVYDYAGISAFAAAKLIQETLGIMATAKFKP